MNLHGEPDWRPTNRDAVHSVRFMSEFITPASNGPSLTENTTMHFGDLLSGHGILLGILELLDASTLLLLGEASLRMLRSEWCGVA